MECLVQWKGLCGQALQDFFHSNRILHLLTYSWANPLMINSVLLGGLMLQPRLIFSASKVLTQVFPRSWFCPHPLMKSSVISIKGTLRPHLPAFFPQIGIASSPVSFAATPWKASHAAFYRGPKGSSQTRHWAVLGGGPFLVYSMLPTEWSSYKGEMHVRTSLTDW